MGRGREEKRERGGEGERGREKKYLKICIISRIDQIIFEYGKRGTHKSHIKRDELTFDHS